MNNEGLYKNNKDAPYATEETIHFSVRVLLGTGLRSCPALKKYGTVLQTSAASAKSVEWRLYRRDGTPTAIRLPEETFSPLERELLETWMEEERRVRGKQHVTPVFATLLLTFSRPRQTRYQHFCRITERSGCCTCRRADFCARDV